MDGKAVKTTINVGDKYGSWTVVRRSDRSRYWFCRCNCGNVKDVYNTSLTRGGSTQCIECRPPARLRHGHGRKGLRTPTYATWQNMRQRCNDPNHDAFEYYGGRGIKICASWDNYENFLADMGEKPVGLTIERKDNNKDYGPGNCVWLAHKEQMRNRRNNKCFVVNGEEMPLSVIAERFSINYRKLHKRVVERGWDIHRAIQP